jgi:nucleoid-associated protein YgaU
VGEVLAAQEAQAATAAPQTTADTAQAPDAPAALPEAPASANVRVTIAGREVQITLRDADETRLLARLEAVLAQFPVAPKPQPQAPLSPQQHHALAMHRPITQTGWCAVHNVQMQHNDKNGRSWWSHRTADGQWCKGRG